MVRVRFDGTFVEGASVTGVITPTAVDEDVARMQEPHAGKTDTWQIVAIEPQRRLAYRWHPYQAEPGADEEVSTTLVEFTLAETDGGVQTDLVRTYLALSEKV